MYASLHAYAYLLPSIRTRIFWITLLKSTLLAALALAAIYALLTYGFDSYAAKMAAKATGWMPEKFGWMKSFKAWSHNHANNGMSAAAMATAKWLFWLLLGVVFATLAPLCSSLFLDGLAEKLEARFYPNNPARNDHGIWPEVKHALGFAVKSLCLNALAFGLVVGLIAINLFFISLPVGWISAIMFLLLNAWLLGTEFFDEAAGRHVGKAQVEAAKEGRRLGILLCGLPLAIASMTLFLAILVPVIGMTLMVHFYQLSTAVPVPQDS